MDCSLPGSSVHGIFQARVLEWGTIAFSTYNANWLLKKKKKKTVLRHCLSLKPSQKYGWRRTCTPFSCKNSKTTIHSWATVSWSMLDPTKIPRAKEKPQQDARRGEIAFRIKPLPARELKQTLCTPGPRDPTDTEPNCVWVSPGKGRLSSGLPQGQGLWVQQTWAWHKPSWRR